MTAATATPVAATKAAARLVRTHQCVKCRALPERPFDPADVEEGAEYRPKTPRPVVSGGPRSKVCKTHERAGKAAKSFTQRTADKACRFGVPRAIQVTLWEFQGSSCPCGRKRSKVIPKGVTLDHEHGAPCIARGDHDEKRGCVECVTGFVCQHCNREIVGRLEGSYRGDRQRVAFALLALAAHVTDPPLARLRAQRPDLFEEIAA